MEFWNGEKKENRTENNHQPGQPEVLTQVDKKEFQRNLAAIYIV